MIEKRNIALFIILSIVTCGIFYWYWIAVLNNDINQLASNEDTSGGMVVLLSIVTCGIYFLFWQYKMGERIDTIKTRNGVNSSYSGSGILYLLLGLFGFSIVSVSLMQYEVNKQVWKKFNKACKNICRGYNRGNRLCGIL